MTEEIDIESDNILNYTNLVIGPPGTGKTTLIRHLADIIRPYVASVIVVNPTNDTKHDYDGLAPPAAIHPRMPVPNPKDPEEWIRKYWDRQQTAANIHNQANDPKILRNLFSMVATPDERKTLNDLEENYRQRLTTITDTQKSQLEIVHLRKTGEYMKPIIGAAKDNKKYNRQRLTSAEKYALEYLYFNARSVLIMDDNSVELAKFLKGSNNELWKDIFYRVRHGLLTIIMGAHSVVDFNSIYCRGFFNVFFTNEQATTGFFLRGSLSFPRDEQKTALQHAKYIFSGRNKEKHMRFWWCRMDPTPYRMTKSVKYVDPPKLGCESFWLLCERCSHGKSKSVLDKNNVYSDLFKLDDSDEDEEKTMGEYY